MANNVVGIDRNIYVPKKTNSEYIDEYSRAIEEYFQPKTHTQKSQEKEKIQTYLSSTQFPTLLSLDYGPALRRIARVIAQENTK